VLTSGCLLVKLGRVLAVCEIEVRVAVVSEKN